MRRLPKIFASSVVRSANQGNSHGGIYLIDLEKETFDQKVDWNNPNISWEGRGGDRGVRGLSIHGGLLYAVAGNELFAFNMETWEIAGSWTTRFMGLTHEAWQHDGKLYICSGGSNSILVFDLENQCWITSYYHDQDCGEEVRAYNPITGEGYEKFEHINRGSTSGYHHLDSVVVDDKYVYFCGASTSCLLAFDKETLQVNRYPEFNISETHNARLHRDGILYNISRLSKTIYQDFGGAVLIWNTPHYKKEDMTFTGIPRDHARQGYTRGMIVWNDFIICGSSPATINVFSFEVPGDPIKSIQIAKDIRNSICGMVLA